MVRAAGPGWATCSGRSGARLSIPPQRQRTQRWLLTGSQQGKSRAVLQSQLLNQFSRHCSQEDREVSPFSQRFNLTSADSQHQPNLPLQVNTPKHSAFPFAFPPPRASNSDRKLLAQHVPTDP